MAAAGALLRKNLPGAYYFLTGIIAWLKRIGSPFSIYITDSLGGSFKEYFISSDMPAKISALKKNLDNESAVTIDVVLQRMLNYPDERYKHKIPKNSSIIGGLLQNETETIKNEIDKKLKAEMQRFPFISKHMEESVFYYFHGLSLLPEGIAGYIKDQDFIDAGAFIGDSAIALKKYSYKKIFSIEMSQKSIEKYKYNLSRCGIPAGQYEILNISLSSDDSKEPVKLNDTGSSGLSTLRKSGKYDEITIDSKSMDYIVARHKISPRFIKVDIEGNGLEFVKGARETLIRFRPVISVAIYHNPYEFFEIKPFLESFLDDYIFMVRKLSTGIKNNLCHSEIVLLGYPKEITG